MKLYAFQQYIRYLRKAKTRHGIHSPFVYGLIEKCLMVSGGGDLYGERLPKYFGKDNLFVLKKDPNKWKEQSAALNNERVLIVPDIHKTRLHQQRWNELIADEKILLTIDLFRAGLLINREDFKEKQHFVLRTK